MAEPLGSPREPGIAEALQANFAAFSAHIAATPVGAAGVISGVSWYLTGIPVAWLNGVVLSRIEGDVDAAIAAVVERFAARRLPMAWFTGAATRPSDPGAALERHGFRREGDWPGMAVDIAALPNAVAAPAEFTMTRVFAPADRQAFGTILSAAFHFSPGVASAAQQVWDTVALDEGGPLRLYLGRIAGQPVATSALYLDGATAGIYAIGTLASERGKGIGAAVTHAALLDARDLGYRVGVLEASQMGYPVYRRLGFEDCCALGYYEWPR